MSSDEYLFTHDAAVPAYDDVETDGITVDDDGEASFDWNEISVVEIDEPAHAKAFDTNQFYKIEGATLARPIKQPYQVGDSVETYKKPADELRDAAWSADNKPYPLTHPDTGMVKSVDDIHGFWKNPRYVGDSERLKSDLYVPVNDDEAKEFIEEYQDVSIGFYNRIHDSYDGDTGDLTDDDVDGFQTNLYIDHIAGVKRGRCSGEDGCGLDHAGGHGKVVMETADGPDMDESDQEGAEEGSSADQDCAPCTNTNMGSNDDGFDIQVDLDDLSLDSLTEEFDAVAELKEERDSAVESLDEVREDLDEHGFDVEEDECPCEVVDDVLHEYEDATDTLETITEHVDDGEELASGVKEMADKLAEYQADEKEEALDELDSLGADREEWEEDSLEDIREEIDRREEVLENADLDTKGIDTDADEDEGPETTTNGTRTFGRGHAAGPQA